MAMVESMVPLFAVRVGTQSNVCMGCSPRARRYSAARPGADAGAGTRHWRI